MQLEALFTQLVFEHALRARATADEGASDGKVGLGSSARAPTTPAGEDNAFLGKLNNLITTDMSNACDLVDLDYPRESDIATPDEF